MAADDQAPVIHVSKSGGERECPFPRSQHKAIGQDSNRPGCGPELTGTPILCTQRSRNCSCVPSGPSSRNAGILTRKRVGLWGKGRQMHTLPATSYKVYFFLRVMILNFLKETLLTLKWGALKVTKQCLISPPQQDWATTGSLRGSEWWVLFREGIRVYPSMGTLRYCCAPFEPKHSSEQGGKGEGEIHKASFSVVLNKRDIIVSPFQARGLCKRLPLPRTVSMQFCWESDPLSRPTPRHSQRPARPQHLSLTLKSMEKCLHMYFQVCVHMLLLCCVHVWRNVCFVCLTCQDVLCLCFCGSAFVYVCLCGACAYMRAELVFMFRLCLWCIEELEEQHSFTYIY